MNDPLSQERLILMRDTLNALIKATPYDGSVGGEGFPGAIESKPWDTFVEADRNLLAFSDWKYGRSFWQKMCDE